MMNEDEYEPGHENCDHPPIRKGEDSPHSFQGAFSSLIGNSFGALEGIQGQEAYQANVDHTKSMANRHNAYANCLDKVASFIGLAGILGVIAFIPVIVWLWKWAT